MNSFIFILLITIINIVFGANQNPGHLKAFGSVGSLINIKELNRELSTVSKLFTYYIPKLEPLISRRLLNEDPQYSIWQTDKQLLNQVHGLADINIQVDSFKSRQPQRLQMTFDDFLYRYGREPLLFADKVPTILQKHLVIPKPFQCETVLETLKSAILLMNGINTSPLLFYEEYDHFHCILRGNKRFVLVNAHKYPDVQKIVMPDRREQRVPPLNPDKVDLDKFPALADVDYHLANLTSGDCLLIPSGWVFQERSLENSIAVIYNIKHYLTLNINEKELETCVDYDSTFTLDQIDWTTQQEPTNIKDLITILIKSKAEGFDKWQDAFSKHFRHDIGSDPQALEIFEEFYALVDIDADDIITSAEIDEINGEHLRYISNILYEMSKVINTNRKKITPKPVDIEEEQISEGTDTEEQTVEHLQNYKIDL